MKINMIIILILAIVFVVIAIIYFKPQKNKSIDNVVELKDNSNLMNSIERTEEIIKIKDWESKFKYVGLEHHWDKFRSLQKNEIRISTENINESEIEIGQSKIGGHPDLPNNQQWFLEDSGKDLSFIAQINLSEVTQFDKSNELPQTGIIYFFYSANKNLGVLIQKTKINSKYSIMKEMFPI